MATLHLTRGEERYFSLEPHKFSLFLFHSNIRIPLMIHRIQQCNIVLLIFIFYEILSITNEQFEFRDVLQKRRRPCDNKYTNNASMQKKIRNDVENN